MNIKTLERAARRAGLILTQEYDEINHEMDYILEEPGAGRTIITNSKKELAEFLTWYNR